LIVVLLSLAGCGSSSNQTVSGDPVAAAAAKTSKQPSEKVGLDAKVDLSGQSVKLGGNGAFSNSGDKGRLRLVVSIGSFGPGSLDEVFDGKTVWLRSPLLTSTLRGKHWIKLDLAKPAQVLGFDLNALAGQAPSEALDALRRSGKVTKVGTDTIDGVQTTHYRKELSGSYRSADAWIDDKGLVRRLKLDYDAKVDPTTKQGARTVLTMDLSDFGTSVSAPPPPAADVVDSSEVGR
jgi:hypothetical protein